MNATARTRFAAPLGRALAGVAAVAPEQRTPPQAPRDVERVPNLARPASIPSRREPRGACVGRARGAAAGAANGDIVDGDGAVGPALATNAAKPVDDAHGDRE